MQLSQPFLKLPIRFDADVLAAEVRALPASAWTPHPTGFVGNEAVRLITPCGEDTDDIDGPMAATDALKRCDYVRQIMSEIGAVWGRSRFMGLAAGREVPAHIDTHYYWRTHYRIHIPVITNPGVIFTCGDETVHMDAGECWLFDSFRWHDVQNKGDAQRIHLVIDTVGGGKLPELMKAAERKDSVARYFPAGVGSGDGLVFERVNSPRVMSPWEMRCHLGFIREQAGLRPNAGVSSVLQHVEVFVDTWAAAWARFGDESEGRETYSELLRRVRADLLAMGVDKLELPNELPLERVIEQLIFHMALAAPSSGAMHAANAARQPTQASSIKRRFDRPVFILSTPRSGSTLLYETLEKAPGLYSIGNESHWLIESIPGLSPPQRGWSSNRLIAEDATADRIENLSESFYRHLTDRDGRGPAGAVRMLEKTPKNALRTPFLNAVWEDGLFVYLYRDVRATLYSMMEAWQSGGFRTYPELPTWRGLPWSLLLVPGWQRLIGMQLPEIVAHQWAITTETLLDDLEQLDSERVLAVDYTLFVASPDEQVERIAHWAGLSWDRQLGAALPLSKTTVSRPNPDKWRRIEPVIASIWPIVAKADARAKDFLRQRSSFNDAARGTERKALSS